jgi:hypothetical protein
MKSCEIAPINGCKSGSVLSIIAALFSPLTVPTIYRDEMGWPIDRQFISLFSLISPKELPEIKIACNQIEDELAPSGRKVNLDAGYLDYDKVVLASAKYNAHKIYLDHGIYADLTLSFHRGVFEPSAYAFPDFKSGAYNSVFFHIRCKYKGQMRRWLSEIRSNESIFRLLRIQGQVVGANQPFSCTPGNFHFTGKVSFLRLWEREPSAWRRRTFQSMREENRTQSRTGQQQGYHLKAC